MKTSEMIAMLEKNPKLSFKRKNREDIYKICDMGFLASIEGHSITPNLRLDDDWQLIREPVPAWEAIKAYVEGKNISCAYEEGWEEYPKNKNEVIFTHKEYEGVGFTSHLLLNGIWYIEDNPHG